MQRPFTTEHAPSTLRLADLVRDGLPDLQAQYAARLTHAHRQALHAILGCRTGAFGERLMHCPDCAHRLCAPRSCGHRSCPQCQHHTASAWLAGQQAKLLPLQYFMITFTLPDGLRAVALQQPKSVYQALFAAAAATLKRFGLNHRQLQAQTGFTAVLHTHNRRLDYHPHLHVVMPASGIEPRRRQWRKLSGRYLFNGKQLARVFRAKMLAALSDAGVRLPVGLPATWVVHCTRVGKGLPALQYLSRYLYRGVIREQDIVDYDREQRTVTFRYQDARTRRSAQRTMGLVDFLWQLLRHVLPTGFRRVREYGFLHANAKRLLMLVQLVLRVRIPPRPTRQPRSITCPLCGAAMAMQGFVRRAATPTHALPSHAT